MMNGYAPSPEDRRMLDTSGDLFRCLCTLEPKPEGRYLLRVMFPEDYYIESTKIAWKLMFPKCDLEFGVSLEDLLCRGK